MTQREQLLDVSALEPPEPLVLTLEAAQRLQRGEFVRMRHRRFPCLLFDNLFGQGFEYLLRHGRDVACEVFIWRSGDAEGEAAALAAADGLVPWQE